MITTTSVVLHVMKDSVYIGNFTFLHQPLAGCCGFHLVYTLGIFPEAIYSQPDSIQKHEVILARCLLEFLNNNVAWVYDNGYTFADKNYVDYKTTYISRDKKHIVPAQAMALIGTIPILMTDSHLKKGGPRRLWELTRDIEEYKDCWTHSMHMVGNPRYEYEHKVGTFIYAPKGGKHRVELAPKEVKEKKRA